MPRVGVVEFRADQLLASLRHRVEGEASPGRWPIALAEHDRALAEAAAGEHDLEALLRRTRDDSDRGKGSTHPRRRREPSSPTGDRGGREVASAADVAGVVVSAAASTPDERPKPTEPAAHQPPQSDAATLPGKATQPLSVAGRSADYDVFVSYKSDDVMVVRPVVDALIPNGARVWFAEYEILLAERERFLERIDEGIRRSASEDPDGPPLWTRKVSIIVANPSVSATPSSSSPSVCSAAPLNGRTTAS